MSTTKPLLTRGDKPETMAQARDFERRRDGYWRLGLCHKCACQASWGHSLGFSRVHPPCTECTPIVAGLPKGEPNGWRSVLRGRVPADVTRRPASVGVMGAGDATGHADASLTGACA